jgi:3',5'-cyclic AMP phosphodiesterase CpdA
MKIIWITDLHLVEPGAAFPAGVDPLARARDCFDDARANHADADLLVITGDLIQLRNAGAYGILRHLLADMPMPVRLLVGNHDDRQALFAAFPEVGMSDGFAQSAEMFGGYRLIYLDTLANDGKHYGELCARRMIWLEEALGSDGAPTLVFMHHPPFDIGVPALDALKLVDGERLAALFKQSDVRQVLCGHLHRCVGGTWFGIPIAVMKSPHVQFALDMDGAKLVRSDEPPGYGVILVEGEQVIIHTRDLSPSIAWS